MKNSILIFALALATTVNAQSGFRVMGKSHWTNIFPHTVSTLYDNNGGVVCFDERTDSKATLSVFNNVNVYDGYTLDVEVRRIRKDGEVVGDYTFVFNQGEWTTDDTQTIRIFPSVNPDFLLGNYDADEFDIILWQMN